MDSDSDSGSEDMDEEPRWIKNKKNQSKTEAKQKKEEATIPKAVEQPKPQDSVDLMKSNIDNLADKIGHLTLALGQFDTDKVT
jgi:hypothetical protein